MHRRVLWLALAVTALLAVVAVAARGRPLSSSSGTSPGPSAIFFDYAATTFLILAGLSAIGTLVVLFIARPERERKPFHQRIIRTLAVLIAFALALVLVGQHVPLKRLRPHRVPTVQIQTTPGANSNHRPGSAQPSTGLQFRWDELVAVLVALLVLGAAAAAARSRLRQAMSPRGFTPEVLAAVLDESLDDLRTDPDLRRAIVAAYARMEVALGAAGLPRKPSEAPLEYLERALLSLDTSAGAVRRLTDLFEWARFSQHEPEPSMRDDAVDALVAVRDELRASEPAVA